MSYKPFTLYFFILIVPFLIFSCGNKEASATEAEISNLRNLVEGRKFTIESDVAFPRATNAMMSIQNSGLFGMGNTANRISLIGNSNYLSIKGDSVTSQLPYFGERQMASGYSPEDTGINLDDNMDDYSAEWNDRKQMYRINFSANGSGENFDVSINVYPNKTCRMTLTGTKRFSIGYAGKITLSETTQ